MVVMHRPAHDLNLAFLFSAACWYFEVAVDKIESQISQSIIFYVSHVHKGGSGSRDFRIYYNTMIYYMHVGVFMLVYVSINPY